MKTLTIISPAYNEEDAILPFIEAVDAELEKLKDRYESRILIVVDKSKDQTLEQIRSAVERFPRVQAIGMSSRFGHQNALLAGIDHSESDVVIMMDSDLQHPPALIPELILRHEEGSDIVYTVKRDDESTTWIRKKMSDMYYSFLNKMSPVPIYANASDFRLISKRVALIFKNQIRERNMFLRGLISWVGYPSSEVKYDVGVRVANQSKYRFADMMGLAMHGLVSFSLKPLRLATLMGCALSALSMAYGLYAIATFILDTRPLPSGWTTLAILGAFLGGMQLLVLGILGEYIGAIFTEVKQRPLYLIEEKINF